MINYSLTCIFFLFSVSHMLTAAPAAKSIVNSGPVEFVGVTAISAIHRPLDEIRKEKREAEVNEKREENAQYQKYLEYKQRKAHEDLVKQNSPRSYIGGGY